VINKELLKQLENELDNITPNFRHTDLYKLLKDKLSNLGYWKARERGDPSKGYKQSPVARHTSQLRQQLKQTEDVWMN
jgi:hypothetical protein